MVEIETNGGFSIDSYSRRLERAGANVIGYEWHDPVNIYSVDMYMVRSDPEELFGSGVELDENGTLEMAQLRMPTFYVEPDLDGLDTEQYKSERASKTLDVYDEIKDDIGSIFVDVSGVDYQYGVIQDDNFNIRPQHGHNRQNITIHIELLRGRDGSAPISRHELVKIIDKVNELWESEYFHLETTSRS